MYVQIGKRWLNTERIDYIEDFEIPYNDVFDNLDEPCLIAYYPSDGSGYTNSLKFWREERAQLLAFLCGEKPEQQEGISQLAKTEAALIQTRYVLLEIAKGYDYLHRYSTGKNGGSAALLGEKWGNEGVTDFLTRVCFAVLDKTALERIQEKSY